MWLNKLKTNKNIIKIENLKKIKNFVNEKNRVDLFVYGNGFMLKKDDLPTVEIWNSNPLPKPYSSSFLSFNTQYLQNKPDGLHILKNNNNKYLESKSDLILKTIKDSENKYKTKNKNQCIHFISEKDYFDNGFIDSKDDNNNNNNNNNIFFIDEERTNTQCSECLSGTLEDIKSFDQLKGYKEYGYSLDSIQSLSKIGCSNLSQCKECNILIDKNVNQIVNFQRKAYSILVSGKSPKYLNESLKISNFVFKCSDKFFNFLFYIIYYIFYFILTIISSFMKIIKFFVK
ncbi:hypothetical protein ACTFIZ_004933 [Dictyostelium cf. discoideum]